MRFLVDANLPTNVSERLRAGGHDVLDVRRSVPPLRDEQIYAQARAEQRVILTRDLDFGNLLRYPPAGTAGIVVLRVSEMTAAEIVELVGEFVRAHHERELVDTLVILEPFRVRFRRAGRETA